jgi:hypothetical protein
MFWASYSGDPGTVAYAQLLFYSLLYLSITPLFKFVILYIIITSALF